MEDWKRLYQSSCVVGLFSKIAAAATYHLLQHTMGMHQLIILNLVHPEEHRGKPC
jgi:hypothetical protein